MNEHLREEEFIPYLDGRVAPGDRARLEVHLAACAACRARCEELGAVLGVLAEWTAAKPSPGFDAALRARLARENESARLWFSVRPAFAGALAAAVVLAVGLALWEPEPPESPPATVAQAPEVVTPPALAPASEVNDDLVVLDNPVLLENYELLEEFDILFEPVEQEEEKL